MMNIFEVNKILKQRPPFQMIERVTAMDENGATGTKTVSANDPWFAGHFPGTPILPGVLIVESCAQLCSVVAQSEADSDEGLLYVLLKVDGFKFLKPVVPGDVMEITVTKKSHGGPMISFDAVVNVAGACRAKGSLAFTAIPRETVEEL